MIEAPEHWYGDRGARSLIALRYAPLLAILNLGWELAQLPLYTIWTEGTRAGMLFAVFHCTLGDLLIGLAALALALTLARARGIAEWQWNRIAILLGLLGAGYTLLSEWANTGLLRWTYSALMPTLSLGEIRIGVSPLVQWLAVPPAALYLARKF